MLKKIAMIIFILITPLVVILTATQIMVSWDNFFSKQYNENDVVFNTGIDMDHLMDITDEIQRYLLGNREDFDIVENIDGEDVHVFNEREIFHMEDVKDLFIKGLIIRNIAFIFMLIAGLYLLIKHKFKFFSALKYSALLYLIIAVILLILFTMDFSKYFVIFHEMFFNNDFWMLDPTDSVLINMVPLNFFINISKGIMVISTATMFIMGIVGFIGIAMGGKKIGKK